MFLKYLYDNLERLKSIKVTIWLQFLKKLIAF